MAICTFPMPAFPLWLPSCHIKFLRPGFLCLFSLIFPLQHSFQPALKLSVNLPDGHLLPSLFSTHNKSYKLYRIKKDSKYPAGLLEYLIKWDPATHISELQPDIACGCQTLTQVIHKQGFWATNQASSSGYPSP